jgi:hypothetical protein
MDMTDRHIMFGLPSYDGKVVTDFSASYARTITVLHNLGIQTTDCRIDGSAYIDRARDEICHVFLKSDATDLLFIDADMGWEPEHVLRLLRHEDKDVLCGMYCRKDPEPIFSIRLNGKRVVKDGMILAQAVPAGFLMIRKPALEELKQAYPELDYMGEGKFKDEKMHAFFHMFIEDGNYYREDIAFGIRYSRIAEGIWVDPMISLRHWDAKQCFDHNFMDYLKSQNLKFAA